MLQRLLLILVFGITSHAVYAADTLGIVANVPVIARLMTVDELGNVYLVKENNELVRYSEQGDSNTSYRSVQNGAIQQVDATNPLRILVYYPAYSKIVILDRMLSLKNELDLRTLRLLNTPAVASSADGKVWVYDQFNARLKKIDDQLNEVSVSNDLRQEIQQVPTVAYLTERNWKVYVCDTAKGIFIFDRYGNYVNTIPLTGVEELQVFGDQLVYRHADTLRSWDAAKVVSGTLLIPHPEWRIRNAKIIRDKLYVLYADRMVLYKLPGQP